MKILYNILLISLAVMLCSLSNCKKGNQDNKGGIETVCNSANTAYFPQDAKDRFFFKAGTWWVYENIDTKERDSIWVKSAECHSWSADGKEGGYIKNKCYESCRMEIFSLKDNASTHLAQRSFSIIGGGNQA